MRKTYTLEVAGLKRDLELYPVSDTLNIAAFIMFGDVEITKACATELLKIAPEHDIMTPTRGLVMHHTTKASL